MTYEKMTDMIELDGLEVQAEEVTEVPSGAYISANPEHVWICVIYYGYC